MQYYVRKLRRRSKSVATMMLENCRVASMRVEREKNMRSSWTIGSLMVECWKVEEAILEHNMNDKIIFES